MPDKKDSEEQLIKKIRELEEKVAASNHTMFSHFYAILNLLEDKNLIEKKEFSRYLQRSKKDFKKIKETVEFIKLMKQLKKNK